MYKRDVIILILAYQEDLIFIFDAEIVRLIPVMCGLTTMKFMWRKTVHVHGMQRSQPGSNFFISTLASALYRV